MKKRIALDMDEVIADIFPRFLDLYEDLFGKRLQKEDYWGSKIYQLPDARQIRDRLHEEGFFADLPVMEGAVEGVRTLMEDYEVYIVTAASEFRNSLRDKHAWLERHFPFIHWKNIVMCGDKSIICTDYMIDDHPFNLEKFSGKGLLFTASHNIHEDRFTRVNDWAEVVDFFEKAKKQDYSI